MPGSRVLLADDHALLLEAYESLLEGEFTIVGRVTNGRELVAAAMELEPEVVVLDVAMPFLSGIEAGRQIHRMYQNIKLVFLTMNEDLDVAAEAFRVGAAGYVLKRCAASELLTAIRGALNGKNYVTPLIAGGLTESLLRSGGRVSQPLTHRQREVLQLLAEGRSMKEVASLLNVTHRTVAFHKYRIMEQLHLASTAELVQYAVKHNLV